VEGDQLTLTGRVLSPDGAEKLEATHSAAADEAIPLGRRVAGDLLSQGAADLIRASRGQMGSHHENAKTRNVETAADKRRSKGDRRIY
jgi:hypothetical protein